MDAAEVLRQAAQVIRERGWTQGEKVDSQGRVCLAGALDAVTSGTPDAEHPSGAAIKVCLEAMDDIGYVICDEPTEWQDAPGRTVEEVLDALERAARGAS